MANEMSVDEAVRIISETNEFGDKFDEAIMDYIKKEFGCKHTVKGTLFGNPRLYN